MEIHRGNAGRVARSHCFARACSVEMHMDISQEPLCAEIHRENVRLVGWTPVLREPAQSKCTLTFHNSNFAWKFTGKLPNATDTTSIEHRALTPTITTPQCGHAVWGTILSCAGHVKCRACKYCDSLCENPVQMNLTPASEKEQQQPNRVSFDKHRRLRGRLLLQNRLLEKMPSSRPVLVSLKVNTPS